MSTPGTAVFLGGVAAESSLERKLAYQCGRMIGRMGYRLFHGGYNGLMKDAARGASEEGVAVFAITLAHKEAWGNFNRYVTRALFVTDLGQRLNAFFSAADVVIAMGGGVGTLHEIAAAIWYAGNVRRIPVILLGAKAGRLLGALKEQGWIYESPTRPVDFLRIARTAAELDAFLSGPGVPAAGNREPSTALLQQKVLDTAMVSGSYVRADGTKLRSYFDPFRLCADPKLIHSAALAMSALCRGPIDVVAGIALGGVPLATHVASVLGKPLVVVRPSPKAYGTFAQVEGLMEPGWHALLVDDVVRNGAAILAARRSLDTLNLVATEAACVLSYGRSGYEFLRDQDVTLHSLIVKMDHEVRTSADSAEDA